MSARAKSRTMRIGVLTPQSGPIGLFGPSSINCAKMAAAELNAQGGILGCKVELTFGDGGGSSEDVVAEAERMIREDHIQGLVGSHVSPNRLALVDAIGGRIPYIYTTMYEGGEHSFGVFVCGETPAQQLQPLMQWMRRVKQARKWYFIGNDYIFPRQSMSLAREYIAEIDGDIVGEEYVPFFTQDFGASLDRLSKSGADAVLIYLVGNDNIVFNRQFARFGLHSSILRAAPVLCENTLMGIGRDATVDLYSATGFTNTLPGQECDRFRCAYRQAFGDTAPVPNRFGLSCYEGMQLLAALAQRAGTLNLYKMQALSDGISLRSPRGECKMTGNHLGSMVHIAEAAGTELHRVDTIGYRAAPPPRHTIWPSDAGLA